MHVLGALKSYLLKQLLNFLSLETFPGEPFTKGELTRLGSDFCNQQRPRCSCQIPRFGSVDLQLPG